MKNKYYTAQQIHEAIDGVVNDYKKHTEIYRRLAHMETDDVVPVQKQPVADPEEQTIYGYSVRFLAYVAIVMQRKGITAEQAADIITDNRTFAELFYQEQQEILKKALDDMFAGAVGKAQKSYADWELRRE